MNIQLNTIQAKSKSALTWLRSHMIFVGILSVVFLYGWLVLQINLLNRREPSDDAVAEKLLTIKRPKIDQDTVNRIQQLQDNNVDVKALFKQARDNPFQE